MVGDVEGSLYAGYQRATRLQAREESAPGTLSTFVSAAVELQITGAYPRTAVRRKILLTCAHTAV